MKREHFARRETTRVLGFVSTHIPQRLQAFSLSHEPFARLLPTQDALPLTSTGRSPDTHTTLHIIVSSSSLSSLMWKGGEGAS